MILEDAIKVLVSMNETPSDDRDRYSNSKQLARCETKVLQIFKRNEKSESMSKRNVIQIIKDSFDEMSSARDERAASAIPSARAATACGSRR